MKKILSFTIVFMMAILSLSAQITMQTPRLPGPLEVEEYTLPNGLKVYLNPDPTQSSVFGAVIVKGGSKRDPADATGIAHYLEHMMFKGTNQIGTVDFEAERVYLDSITAMYDLLGKTNVQTGRDSIQKVINRLSVKAAEWAIPGEMDRILNSFGSTNLNAFTSQENIVYFNMFPGAHIEKWIEVYSHRFENPIFRLFQSELETVYEEKNMYSDNSFSNLLESFLKNFFRNSPYGQQTVIGSTEHLKNPSLSKMYEYFNTYYVANNMALVLSGDFNAEQVRPIIAQKFGAWRSGQIPPLPSFAEAAFNGRETKSVRMTPIKIGILGFRSIPKGHPDGPVIDLISELLSNSAGTGFLDKLYVDNKILGAGMFNMQFEETGGAIVFFVPKIVGQSFAKAENIILAEFAKIVNGDFTDDQLESARLNMMKQNMQEMEHPMQRGMGIMEAFNMNMTWSQYLRYQSSVEQITREEVRRVAAQYFGKNYLAFFSKTGFPKKEKLAKPPYDPVSPTNSEASSQFAVGLEAIPSYETPPKFIDFNSDVRFMDMPNGGSFYHTDNPINTLFSLSLQFGAGKEAIKILDPASEILDMAHPADMTYQAYKEAFNRIGTSLSVYVTDDYTVVRMSGFDNKLEESIELLAKLMKNPSLDKKHLKKILESRKANLKTEKKEPSVKGDALLQYALYKDRSDYLSRYSGKELKKLNTDSMLAAFKKAMQYRVDVFYSGTVDYQTVAGMLRKLELPAQALESQSPIDKPRETYTEPLIYLMNDPKAVQSQIHVYVNGMEVVPSDIPYNHAFNEYFGGNMSSIVFQEVREYRSLAYAAYANYNVPYWYHNQGYLSGFMSTQADKTTEALSILTSLIKDMPQKDERLENIRSALVESTRSSKPGFRNMGQTVANYRRKGHADDPRKEYLKTYDQLNFLQIVDFHLRHVANKPLVICIVTDVKRVNLEELKAFGKVVEVKHDLIFRK